jgi:cystathionine beta-lyase/cystathionine gamma-synthase
MSIEGLATDGGAESLIEHPWIMTHQSMPEDFRAAAGITEILVCVSVGLEHVDDLIDDLVRELAKV